MSWKSYSLLFSVYIICFFASVNTNAQSSVHDFDDKFRIEKTITDRLEQTLKTRLDKAYFDITVDAQIAKRHDPASRSLHDKVVFKSSGERDLLQTWLLQEISQNNKALEIQSLKITLGLSDKVQASYRQDLGKWLQEWTLASFGSMATSEVTLRPTDVITKDSYTESPLAHFLSGLSAFQNLIGMLFLGGIFLVTYFKSRHRDVTPTNPSKEVITLNTTENISNLPEVEFNEKDQNHLRSLKTRVALVSKTMSNQAEYLISRWGTKEHENLIKIVTLLEAMAESGISLDAIQNQTLPVLSREASASLSKAFLDLHKMSNSEQIEILEEIYSELVAGNLMRLSSHHSSFEFLDKLNGNELKSIFEQLSSSEQITLLAKLPDNTKLKLANAVDAAFMNKLLENSFELSYSSDQELLEQLKKIGVLNGKTVLPTSDNMEQKIHRLREMWAAFSPREEILWMHHFVERNAEMKKYFENEPNHLAFLAEWPQEKLRRLCLQTTTHELAAAAKCLPFLSPAILGVCGEATRQEIQNCMQSLEEPRLTKKFERFLQTYEAYLLDDQFPQQKDQAASKGAA